MKDPVIVELLKTFPPETVIIGEGLKNRYSHVWHMDVSLEAKGVIMPRTTEEVAAIMKICHNYAQPVVIHGGLTNLVGSTTSTEHDLVISLEKMNTIEEVDPDSRTITAQAGVILEEIQQAAAEKGMLFPMNFGAKGSAQLGGIISTNAGGLRVLKYGMMRQLVLGIEAVTAQGTIISSMKKIIKDNSGYDLKQLFIGAEGTLGIITSAILKLVEAPTSRVSAFAGLDAYHNVVAFLKHLDKGMAGTLSAFELLWKKAYIGLTSPPSLQKPPLPYNHHYYVLMEGLGADKEFELSRLQRLLEEALNKGIIEDAVMAQSQSDLQWFWQIREDVHPLLTYGPSEQSFDISLPIPAIGEIINSIIKELESMEGIRNVFTFGHVADGNIHFLILKDSDDPALTLKVNAAVYGPLKKIKGSISAEHGIGIDKISYLPLCRTPEEIGMMKLLKQTLDPKNILNKGRIIP